MTKSYVSMEANVCQVCGVTHETGSILLDRHLKDRFEHQTVTGYSLCPEHEKLHQEGYVALVAVDKDKSRVRGNTANPGEVYRTGDIVHIRRSAFGKVFDCDAPEGPLAFCDEEVVTMLKKLESEAPA